MRIVKLFKNHVLALIAAVALIAISCNAELTLPAYMSEIVDVGIQQGGIESPVPDTIRRSSLDNLEMFMSEEDVAIVEAAYSSSDDQGVCTYQGSEAERDEDGAVAQAMSLPETVVLALAQGVDLGQLSDASPMGGGQSSNNIGAAPVDANQPTDSDGGASPMGDSTSAASADHLDSTASASSADGQLAGLHGGTVFLDDVRAAYAAGLLSRDQLVQGAQTMAESMGEMGGSIVRQRAVGYVQQEYQAQGINLADVQNSYLADMTARMFGLCLVSLVATILTGAVASHTACTIARDLRRKTFHKVMSFSPAEVNKFSQASLITRCTNDIQQVQMACTMLIRMVLMAPIMGTVALVRVFATRTGLEWTVGVAVIAVSAVVGVLMGLTMPKFKRMQQCIDRVNLVAREMLDGLMPIRAFNRQGHELERFDKASTDLMGTQLFTNRAMSFMMPLMMLVMNCIMVLIVWLGSHGVNDGIMQVGDMMAFMSYTMQIVMSFMILTMVGVMLPRAAVACERVEEVLNTESSIREPACLKTPDEGVRGELELRDVAFRYPDADEDVVSGVSFKVRAGEMLGIIGSTGSGKTSIVQLIARLYDATSGTVLIDGVDVREMALSEVRRRVGYIPQQGMLFSGTVESNLKFAGECVTDEDMRRAANIAQASEFIAEREGGFASDISQGGTNVSGGQRQRLSIARALAKNPEIIVFDDSFSALDYKTDAKLREALAQQEKDAAIVVVAQRIATIMHATQIVVLEEGAVVGQGTHEELLRSCPTYLEIAQSQLSAEELGLTEEEIATVKQAAAFKGGER